MGLTDKLLRTIHFPMTLLNNEDFSSLAVPSGTRTWFGHGYSRLMTCRDFSYQTPLEWLNGQHDG